MQHESPSLYELLRTTTSIRLLRIQPEVSISSCIECSLHQVDLISNPVYRTLSYTWDRPYTELYLTLGNNYDETVVRKQSRFPHQLQPSIEDPVESASSSRERIICNGHMVSVAENLYHALLQLRQMPDIQYLWVDAICINQADLEERAQQVSVMGKIYASAEQVIVWLGQPNQDFKDFFWGVTTFLEKLSLLLEAHGQDYLERRNVSDKSFQYETGMQDLVPRLCGYVRFQCACRWFSRTWIVQEIVNSRDILVLCGTEKVPWLGITALSEKIWRSGILGQLCQLTWGSVDASLPFVTKNMSAWQWQLYRDESGCESIRNDVLGPTEARDDASKRFAVLVYASDRLAFSNCQNPRDKIYVALGLVNKLFGQSVEPLLIPDYKASVVEVYTHMAWKCIYITKSLVYLGYGRDRERSTIIGLPSWVPD
jgi:hypothetical protein